MILTNTKNEPSLADLIMTEQELAAESDLLATQNLEVSPSPFGKGNLFDLNDVETPVVLNYLKQVEQEGLIQSVDYHFASFIHNELGSNLSLELSSDVSSKAAINLMTLLAAFTSNQVLNQHTCIKLTSFNPAVSFKSALPHDLLLPDRNLWLEVIGQNRVCQSFAIQSFDSEPQTFNLPFVLYGDLLYLNRYFQYEWFIANFIKQSNMAKGSWFDSITQEQVNAVCDQYFAPLDFGEIDWQKQAVSNAIKRSFAVITGGPGTGKTTTVVKLLACLQELKLAQSTTALNIQLVAPTGKAAQRLSESVSASVNSLGLAPEIQQSLPIQASTIHRLLKPRGLSQFTYHKNNRLSLDVLILDEASMVDISLMFKLLCALPDHAQVILLGDRQQLASVEAGNVLAELAQSQNNDFMVELKKSYRFDDKSEIGQLANAIKQGQSGAAVMQLKQPSHSLSWYQAERKQLPLLVEYAVEHHVKIRAMIRSLDLALDVNIEKVFAELAKFQLFACVRQGEYGVEGLNSQIQSRIAKRTQQSVTAIHYEYRPIMISENAYHLDLYNGDIGIELVNPVTKQLMAYFIQGDGSVKQIHCQRLPSHETVYAMTVHKSQGSEFAHAALVLPDHGSSLVSKEIIYTGLTRAKSLFSIYASEYNIKQGLQSSAERYSGLSQMLAI